MENPFYCHWPAKLPRPFERPTRSERRDTMNHRQRILEVAEQLFANSGVEAVSMHQIALVAGIGQGTLYRRYAHKGELCLDLLQNYHERFAEEVKAICIEKAASPALERLDGVLECCIEFLEAQGALLEPVAACNRGYQFDEAGNSRIFGLQHSPFYIWLHKVLMDLLTEAVQTSEISSHDMVYTADAILATLHPLFYRFQRQERGFSSERILQGLRHIYIDGMK